jgi:hypothetical protein
VYTEISGIVIALLMIVAFFKFKQIRSGREWRTGSATPEWRIAEFLSGFGRCSGTGTLNTRVLED